MDKIIQCKETVLNIIFKFRKEKVNGRMVYIRRYKIY